MVIDYDEKYGEYFPYHEDDFIFYLYNQLLQNKKIIISLVTEGYSCREGTHMRIFEQLEKFCEYTQYPANNITVITGNMIETHPSFNIVNDASFWYEVNLIKKWLLNHDISDVWKITNEATKFGSFIGGSNWYRLWISAYLYKNHKELTVQTFHSSYNQEYIESLNGEYVEADKIGVGSLICNSEIDIDVVSNCIDFVKQCPIIYSKHDSTYISEGQHTAFIKSNNNLGYPIQFPTNMHILTAYKTVFVDIVQETVESDETFFITEKTWRPIIAKRPFIIMGSAHVLKNLQVLGFKTFNDFWDESYDDYGYEARVRVILQLVDKISMLSTESKYNMLSQMQGILDYNLNVLRNLTEQKILECIPLYEYA